MSRFLRIISAHKVKLLVAGLLLGAILAALPQQHAKAVTGGEFQAGRIMDDAIFYNANSMTVEQVQNFLNAKVPTCDNWGTQPYAGTTRRAYSEARGEKFPLTCVKDYYENPNTKENNLEGRPVPGGAMSAAQIIVHVAKTFNISPQVLITLIQKEQALIADSWPWAVQYQKATGVGCPDTAPCNAQYFGFYNQVYNAARHFRNYANSPNSYNHIPNANNFVRWSPNSACGGSQVYIQNQATASLYNYTPYQPNQAALNNLHGTGDDCSAYGNRNFWRIFNDWFGPTLTDYSTSKLNWNFEQLQGAGGVASNVAGSFGKFSKTISMNGVLHVLYYDEQSKTLKRAWADGSGWHFETVDGAGGANGRISANVGGYISVANYNNQLYVGYYNFDHNDLRLAVYNQGNNTWTASTLDGAGGADGRYTTDVGKGLTLTPFGDSLQAFYYDASLGNLRHAWLSSGQWRFENLDGDWGAIAKFDANAGQSPIAAESGGTLQLFYFDVLRGNLRHAWVDTRGWHFENLDGDIGSVSRAESNVGLDPFFVNYGGTLQLFYYDLKLTNLRHAWTSPTGWKFEYLDGDIGSVSRKDADVGRSSSVEIFNNDLYVFYYDMNVQSIKMAYADPSGWRFAFVDGVNTALSRTGSPVGNVIGNVMSADVHGGSLQLYYQDKNSGALRHGWGVTP